MKYLSLFAVLVLLINLSACIQNSISKQTTSQYQHEDLYSLQLVKIDGAREQLSAYRGKVLLISNISVRCGTTPQLAALQSLHEQYQSRGFSVLAFPSNDFTGIEPKDPRELATFCSTKFGTTFPIFAMTRVKLKPIDPLFNILTNSTREEIRGEVGFNFEKFLISKHGEIVERYGPFTSATSERVKRDIERLLYE